MDNFIQNINPLNSPVTQVVLQSTAQAVTGVVQAATAPVAALASKVGIDLNPMHSPVYTQAIKPAADLVGMSLIGVPLGTLGAQVGGMVGATQDKLTGSGPYAPRPAQQVVVQLPAPLPATATQQQHAQAQAQAQALLPAGVPLVAVQRGYRAGTWPRYYRRA
jgi:hypothetical protein